MTSHHLAPATGTDTFERSCAHWSEASRAEMNAFYALATEDYRQLALAVDWNSVFQTLLAQQPRPGDLRLLDVACGSGKFPAALQAHADLQALTGHTVRYALLDPSAFSLHEAKGALRPPFVAAEDYLATLQGLACDDALYDIVWATHALYALPITELPDGLRNLVRVLAPGGVGFVAHASRESHYLRFYDLFLKEFRGGVGTPYTSSEELMASLRAQGVPFVSRRISYVGTVAADNTAVLQGYLQRCLFDDTMTLPQLRANAPMNRYLESFLDASGQHYEFRQQTDLIFFTTPGAVPVHPWRESAAAAPPTD